MIVDTSVLAAILFREAEGPVFADTLTNESSLAMSGGNWLELTGVLARRGRPELLVPAEQLARAFRIHVQPVTIDQIEIARSAYLRFGRGSRHRADLNFGDCFAYALAHASGEPLLFKGDDFNHTDLRLAAAASFPR